MDHFYYRNAWELFIIGVALYSVVVIPIKIGVDKYILGKWYDWIDLITYFFYLFDVLINMRTTFINTQGVEVRDAKKIRKRYIYSFRFVTDVISLINLPMMSKPLKDYKSIRDLAQLCGLFKVSKIGRLERLNAQSTIHKDTKGILSLIYYTLLLVIYMHLTGCLIFYVYLATYERSTDFLSIQSSLGLYYLPEDQSISDYRDKNEIMEKYDYSNMEKFLNGTFDSDHIDYYNEVYKTKDEMADIVVVNHSPIAETIWDITSVPAWVPPFDNFDGTEKFWCLYEKSRATIAMKEMFKLEENPTCKDSMSSSFFIYMVVIYYALCVIGGNELQPA